MRAVVQRVSQASVTVERRIVGQIGAGLLVLVGVAGGDAAADVEYMATKMLGLRIFADDEGRMNRSVLDVGGALLLVSQFTLMGDARRGRRPAFDGAAPPADARALFDDLVMRLRPHCAVETGIFQAHMDVALVNDGPVTVLLDSRRLF